MKQSGTAGDRLRLRPLKRILDRVNAHAEAMREASDEELRSKTAQFKARFQRGETLDALLPEAYAAAREACRRVLGMYPYDVQVLGAAALHRGQIAEMKTGEGKTLTAVMPLYLNALTGRSCILVTMNEYLAARDGAMLRPVYEYLGMRSAVGVPPVPGRKLNAEQKRRIYGSDIVYTTHGSLGFDYLIENLAGSRKDRFLREFYYCIVDEADSVLLDSAQTPLVISGAPRVRSNLYGEAENLVSLLSPERDYVRDEDDAVWLTEEGVRRAERFYGIPNLFAKEESERMRHIVLALRAHALYEKDRNYLVDEGQVKLLDSVSGRVLESTKLRGGQHQAIEAKEHLRLTPETRAMASITYQDFFRLFPKLAGMSGSAADERRELKETYRTAVVSIPTHRPMLREDLPDVVCASRAEQLRKAVDEIGQLYGRGEPVLVFADSIRTSQLVSDQLLERGIPHNVLNAYNTAREAMIIAEAGHPYAVTVATAVAGRGTDIRLQEDAAQRGGLAVIGIGRMAGRRQEVQARGRSGRQGDPGFSRFYISPEDEVAEKCGAGWLEKYRSGQKGTTLLRLGRAVNAAQRISEEQARAARQMTAKFGRTMLRQRQVIYRMRDEVLEGKAVSGERLLEIAAEVNGRFLDECGTALSRHRILRWVLDQITYRVDTYPVPRDLPTREGAERYLARTSGEVLEAQKERLGGPEAVNEFLCAMTLKAIDEAWIEQVDYLQQLRLSIMGRGYAGRDPVLEYHKEAYRAFSRMEYEIRKNMMRNILLGEIVVTGNRKWKVIMP